MKGGDRPDRHSAGAASWMGSETKGTRAVQNAGATGAAEASAGRLPPASRVELEWMPRVRSVPSVRWATAPLFSKMCRTGGGRGKAGANRAASIQAATHSAQTLTRLVRM